MSFKKEEFSSFEIQELDGTRLFFTDKNFDFPKVFDKDGNLLENVLMIKGRNLPEITSDRYVYVIALAKSGDRLRFKTALSVSSRFQMNILLDPDRAETLEERRRYFKIKTDEKAYITFVEVSEDETVALDPPTEINVKDINVGGIFFVCLTPNVRFEQGNKIMFIVNLDGHRLEMLSEILRIQKIPDSDEVGYGCRFVKTTTAQEEIISRYVYKLQFELLRKERELKNGF